MMIKRIVPAMLFGLALIATSQAHAQNYNGSSDRRLAAEEDNDILDTPGEVVDGVTSGVGGIVSGTSGVLGGFGMSDDASEARCARAFRSFNPETGTYTTYAGQTVRCPYLD